jgi:hypothetical protein
MYLHIHGMNAMPRLAARPMFHAHWFRWIIQEISLKEGYPMYLDVLYRSEFITASPTRVIQQSNWISMNETLFGAPPTFIAIYSTADIDDCTRDDCIEYFLRQQFISIVTWGDCSHGSGQLMRCTCDNTLWMRILSSEDLAQYQFEYQTYRSVVIKDFLVPSVLEWYQENLAHRKHSLFWQRSFWNPYNLQPFVVEDSNSTTQQREEWVAWEYALRREGKESHCFSRSVLNGAEMPWFFSYLYQRYIETFQWWLQSNEMQTTLKQITGKKYKLEDLYLIRLHSGDL